MTSIETTEAALAALGVTDDDFTAEEKRRLDEDGYVVVPDVFSPGQLDELRREFVRWEVQPTVRSKDSFIEPGGRQIQDLFNKSIVFDYGLMSRPSLAAAHHLMGEIRVFSLNGRNPAKGMGQQALHSDVTRLHPGDWRLVNTMIMVDDLTDDNGPTRLVPGSHKLPPLNVPDGNLVGATRPELTDEERSLQPVDSFAEHPREVKVTGSAGSVCVINGCIWHGGTRNRSGAQRRLLHMAIGRRDLPAHHDHRGTLTPALRRRATPAVSYLLDIEGAEAQREDYILP